MVDPSSDTGPPPGTFGYITAASLSASHTQAETPEPDADQSEPEQDHPERTTEIEHPVGSDKTKLVNGALVQAIGDLPLLDVVAFIAAFEQTFGLSKDGGSKPNTSQ